MVCNQLHDRKVYDMKQLKNGNQLDGQLYKGPLGWLARRPQLAGGSCPWVHYLCLAMLTAHLGRASLKVNGWLAIGRWDGQGKGARWEGLADRPPAEGWPLGMSYLNSFDLILASYTILILRSLHSLITKVIYNDSIEITAPVGRSQKAGEGTQSWVVGQALWTMTCAPFPSGR